MSHSFVLAIDVAMNDVVMNNVCGAWGEPVNCLGNCLVDYHSKANRFVEQDLRSFCLCTSRCLDDALHLFAKGQDAQLFVKDFLQTLLSHREIASARSINFIGIKADDVRDSTGRVICVAIATRQGPLTGRGGVAHIRNIKVEFSFVFGLEE